MKTKLTIKFINAITKVSVTGFKGKSGSRERHFNNPKHPCKTPFSTSTATMNLFKAYN